MQMSMRTTRAQLMAVHGLQYFFEYANSSCWYTKWCYEKKMKGASVYFTTRLLIRL